MFPCMSVCIHMCMHMSMCVCECMCECKQWTSFSFTWLEVECIHGSLIAPPACPNICIHFYNVFFSSFFPDTLMQRIFSYQLTYAEYKHIYYNLYNISYSFIIMINSSILIDHAFGSSISLCRAFTIWLTVHFGLLLLLSCFSLHTHVCSSPASHFSFCRLFNISRAKKKKITCELVKRFFGCHRAALEHI